MNAGPTPRLLRPLPRLLRACCWCGVALVLLAALAWQRVPFDASRYDGGASARLVHGSDDADVLLELDAPDGARRFPVTLDDVAPVVVDALIAAEDERFTRHHGVDPIAVARASIGNLLAGHVVSGASTISMQVVGLAHDHPRTFAGKAFEAWEATRLERAVGKRGVLERWLNAAPFGGNVVGIEAAARRWFDKSAADVDLAEAALLVALPNAPTRLRPDRAPDLARARRDRILGRMHAAGMITEAMLDDARARPIRVAARVERTNDSHAGWAALARAAPLARTTIDRETQRIVERLADAHARTLAPGSDVAVVVADARDATIRAWLGSADPADPLDGAVDGVLAARSPGSTLKPFLYAAAFEADRLSPDSLVDDTPLEIERWRPGNLDHEFRGRMTAAEALRSSRNPPAIRVLRGVGVTRARATLRRCGIPITTPMASDAGERVTPGLALATGAVETRLLDLAEAWTTLAAGGIHRTLRLLTDDSAHPRPNDPGRRALSMRTVDALDAILARPLTVARIGRPLGIVAKTGTSSGHRDALTLAHDGRFVVAVRICRFDGGADPAFTGARVALPLAEAILAALARPDAISTHEAGGTIRRPVATALPTWRVGRPLEGLIDDAAEESITFEWPPDGAVIASDDPTALRPRLRPPSEGGSISEELHWFLNGRPCPPASFDARLRALEPGATIEWRVVDERGRFDVVSARWDPLDPAD